MKRILLMAPLLALLVPAAIPAKSEAAVSVGVSLHVGDPYRGFSLQFRSQPDMVLVPATRVYYVRDYDHDLYRYGRSWYYVEDNSWYQSSSYNGPFVQIAVSSVPRQVYNVPTRYRRAWGGPPSHAPAYGYRRNHQAGYQGGGNRGGYQDQDGWNHGSRDNGGWQRNDDRNDDRWSSNDQQRRDRHYDQDGRYGSR